MKKAFAVFNLKTIFNCLIFFFTVQVETRDAGYGDSQEGRNLTWEQMGSGDIKQESMDPGYERFGSVKLIAALNE